MGVDPDRVGELVRAAQGGDPLAVDDLLDLGRQQTCN